jgi:UDP-N-acetylglucosamine--N-acetylmuramyl-(pentapeptide) pyrophosphoryl-undecaprenol N-acetylglucosamine transferase
MPKIGSTLELTIISMNEKKTICFVAGKSGGHLLPAITLAKQHKEKYPKDRIVFITTTGTIDKTIINEHCFINQHEMLNLDNIPKSIWSYPLYTLKLALVIVRCLKILKGQHVTKIVSTGGYLLLPIAIAARLFSIPVELYELNALPGKAVKMLAPLVTSIYTCFKSTQQFLPQYKCILSSYPLKFNNKDKITQKEALIKLQLSTNKKTLFILGGSQGSLFINSAIKDWLEKNTMQHNALQIIHQTGMNDKIDWQALYKKMKIPAHVFNYTHQLADYYNAADLVLCRAGAGTLFEVVFFNKPCITIPLATKSTDHQVLNAQSMVQEHPLIISMITQNELEKHPQMLMQAINKYLMKQ